MANFNSNGILRNLNVELSSVSDNGLEGPLIVNKSGNIDKLTYQQLSEKANAVYGIVTHTLSYTGIKIPAYSCINKLFYTEEVYTEYGIPDDNHYSLIFLHGRESPTSINGISIRYAPTLGGTMYRPNIYTGTKWCYTEIQSVSIIIENYSNYDRTIGINLYLNYLLLCLNHDAY